MVKLDKKLLSNLGFHIETKGNEIDLVCGLEVNGTNGKVIYTLTQ